MDDAKIIDLAARRAEKQKAAAKPYRCLTIQLEDEPKPRLSPEMLKRKQQKVIEELRALGYEMTNQVRR